MATLIAPKAIRLKSLASIAQPARLSRTSRTAFSTAIKPWDTTKQPQRPSITSRIPPPSALSPSTAITRHARHESTSPASQTTQTIPDDVLTWDRFFNLRRKRRFLNMGSSIATASTSVAIFGPVLAQQDIDGWAANVMGLDPFIVLGGVTFAVATMGWLCGPTFGNVVFKMWAGRKGWNQAIAEKEKSFYARIKRYRADPASSSPQNPIPDYYGEKIASVKDYRRWLKDQRAFNLKKNKNML